MHAAQYSEVPNGGGNRAVSIQHEEADEGMILISAMSPEVLIHPSRVCLLHHSDKCYAVESG